MKFCTVCGKEMIDEAVTCPNCGCAVAKAPTKATDDEISVGYCVLSALVPLFGLIYWGVKNKETPRKAQACGITALIAWIVSFVVLMTL